MTERPEPLVGKHVDISKLDGFMLDTVRLLGSELVALSTGDEFKAAVLLWSRAWKQTPACSLPNDDRVLASFAMVPLTRWRKVKEMALRGFVECSDGRLYHRVLAEDALRAWEALERRRERTRAATEARKSTSQNERNDQRNDARYERRDDERNVDRNDQRNEVPYTARDGTGRDGTVKKDQQQPPDSLPRDPDAAGVSRRGTELIEAFDRICREIWPESPRPWPASTDAITAENWLKSGADSLIVETVARAVLGRRKAKAKTCPTSLAFIDAPVLEALQGRVNGTAQPSSPPKKRRFGTYSDETLARFERENAAAEAAKKAAS